jgi:ABC-type lipoprotein release transport system permease subunit
MALGADSVDIARSVFSHGLRVTAIGMAVGILLTVTAGRLSRLPTARPGDLSWMIAAVAGFMLVLTLLACWVPMRRALAVDPMTALRSE